MNRRWAGGQKIAEKPPVSFLRRGDSARTRRARSAARKSRGAYNFDRRGWLRSARLPPLQATIAARIDRLEPEAKETLSAAAVIGSGSAWNFWTALGVDPYLRSW